MRHIEMLGEWEGSYEQTVFRSDLLDARMLYITSFWLSFQELRCVPLEKILSPPLIAAKHISFFANVLCLFCGLILLRLIYFFFFKCQGFLLRLFIHYIYFLGHDLTNHP